MYFAPLPGNQTINSDVYCQKLIKLDKAIKQKQPEFSNNKQQCKTSFMIGNSWKNIGTWLQSLLGDYMCMILCMIYVCDMICVCILNCFQENNWSIQIFTYIELEKAISEKQLELANHKQFLFSQYTARYRLYYWLLVENCWPWLTGYIEYPL